MKTLLLQLIAVAALILSLPVSAGEGAAYFEAGVGIHRYQQALPEVDLQTPLGRMALGYESRDNWIVELSHTSSIPQAEHGSGLNALWIKKRIYFH